jgi:hypothetical protein
VTQTEEDVVILKGKALSVGSEAVEVSLEVNRSAKAFNVQVLNGCYAPGVPLSLKITNHHHTVKVEMLCPPYSNNKGMYNQ